MTNFMLHLRKIYVSRTQNRASSSEDIPHKNKIKLYE